VIVNPGANLQSRYLWVPTEGHILLPGEPQRFQYMALEKNDVMTEAFLWPDTALM
jgi:hypothetical protein